VNCFTQHQIKYSELVTKFIACRLQEQPQPVAAAFECRKWPSIPGAAFDDPPGSPLRGRVWGHRHVPSFSVDVSERKNVYRIAIDRIEKRLGGSFNTSMRRQHAFHDADECSSYLAPPTRNETKSSRARSFGMVTTSLHRKNLAHTKVALFAVAGKDDSAVKYEATNLVVVGMDVADLVGLHFPFHNLAKTVVAQFGFKF